MTRQLHPADALELSLAGIVSADAADELLAVVASLRAASGGIMAPTGLRARRGALVARGRPLGARRPLSLGRRFQASLMAATFAAVASVSFVGAHAALSWLRDVVPDAPAPYMEPGRLEGDSTPSPTPSPTPNPVLQGLLEPEEARPADGSDATDIELEEPERGTADDEDDPWDAEPEDDDDDQEGNPGGDAAGPEGDEPHGADSDEGD